MIQPLFLISTSSPTALKCTNKISYNKTVRKKKRKKIKDARYLK